MWWIIDGWLNWNEGWYLFFLKCEKMYDNNIIFIG